MNPRGKTPQPFPAPTKELLATKTDRDILGDVLTMATNAANSAAIAASRAEYACQRSDTNDESIGRLTAEISELKVGVAADIGALRHDVGRWPKGPDDKGSGVLGVIAARHPSLVDSAEASGTIPPQVRSFFRKVPIAKPVIATLAAVIATGLAVGELLGILR